MNIREILVDLSKSELKSPQGDIARIILENYNLGIFKNQSDLAKQCFVSESVLTKFSKKLGYTGFREFNFSLKNEYDKYYNRTEKSKKIEELKVLESFPELVNNGIQFFDKFVNHVLKTRKVLIISSYNLISCARFAVEVLSDANIEVLFLTERVLQNKLLRKWIGLIPCLLFLGGQDNTFMLSDLNSNDVEHLNNNLFVISSESQSKKIRAYNELFVINGAGPYINWIYRKVLIDHILLEIHKRLK